MKAKSTKSGKAPAKKNTVAKKTTGTVKKSAPKKTVAPKNPAPKVGPKKTAEKNTGTDLSKKIERAETLRLIVKKTESDYEKVVNEWNRQVKKTKDKAAIQKLDNKYEKKVKVLEERDDKAYKSYYDYVHNNFTPKQCNTALKSSGNFINKSYTNALKKAVKNGK